MTFGTYDDGWLKPHTPAIICVFPFTGQRRPRIQFLYLQIWAPTDIAQRPFVVHSNLRTYRATASNSYTSFVNAFPVCVPATGHANVTISSADDSTIPGDLSSLSSSLQTRTGSIYLADASISNNLGKPCGHTQ